MRARQTSPGWRRILRQDMRRQVLWPVVRLTIVLYAVVAVVILLTLLASCAVRAEPARSEVPEPYASILDRKAQRPCDWQREFHGTITALGADPAAFQVSPEVPLYGQVNYDEGVARIDAHTPCRFVADTVRHEWMHLLQGRDHGGLAGVRAHYDSTDHTERVADCGARMLGSATTPYVDPDYRGTELFVGVCRPADIREARRLLSVE